MTKLKEALNTRRVGKYNVGDPVTLDGKPGKIASFELAKTKGPSGVGWWARIQFANGGAQWLDMSQADKLQKEAVSPTVSRIRQAIVKIAKDGALELDSIIRSGKVARGQEYDKVTRQDNRQAAKYVINTMKDVIGKLDQIDKMGL